MCDRHFGAHAEEERRHFFTLEYMAALELHDVLNEGLFRVRRLLEHTHPSSKAVCQLVPQRNRRLTDSKFVEIIEQALCCWCATSVLHSLCQCAQQRRKLGPGSKTLLETMTNKLGTVVNNRGSALGPYEQLSKLLVLLDETDEIGTDKSQSHWHMEFAFVLGVHKPSCYFASHTRGLLTQLLKHSHPYFAS